MNPDVYDDMALEQIAKSRFGMSIDIDHVVVRAVPVSRVARATLFLTTKKQLLLYVTGTSRLLLSDIKKIVSRMGLTAELYIPPKAQPNYFDDIGTQKFKDVFPGRSHPSKADLQYYRTLAPYNPALVQISEVRTGEIKQFDTDAANQWRVVAKFAYRRIKAI
ncbi:MAG TPA: hypothetical protein PK096_02485 [Candidatus Saccharibacteria bacterium]|nr:hypothetical protein [Candidatus Saccharibacteria bacterium]HRK94211.1 hypothetical protein [Candidatus Saccharibacteria bacterium]